MNLIDIVIILLLINAFFHAISFFLLRNDKAPSRWGVLAFVIINTVIGVSLLKGTEWAEFLALAFPLIGGVGLSLQIKKTKYPYIDYVILGLDILIVGIMLYLFFG